MDHVVVYELNHNSGKLRQVDFIRSEQESAPRHMKFSRDGRFLYIVHELKNYIDVYTYSTDEHNMPVFEKIQNITTLNNYHTSSSAASALNLSEDFRYLCGDYPKDAAMFPDNRHLVSLNHESNTMTFFTIDIEKETIVMNGPEMKVDSPNCIIFYRLDPER